MEVVRSIEKIREQIRANAAPLVDLKSVWTFASILLLPPVLAIVMSALGYTHMRLRIIHRETFRWVYSAATAMLATAAACGVLDLGMPAGTFPGLPVGWNGVVLIVLAGLVRWFVNHGLVVVIILLSSPSTPGKDALGNFSDNIVETAALSLGAVAALVIEHDIWYLLLMLPPILVLHRSLLMRQYEVAARTDAKTGLANATHWSQMARSELARAERYETSVGILMLDLDHFKRINDTYGHLTGDKVLKAVADALRKETRDYDLVGRLGGGGVPGFVARSGRPGTARDRGTLPALREHGRGDRDRDLRAGAGDGVGGRDLLSHRWLGSGRVVAGRGRRAVPGEGLRPGPHLLRADRRR